MKKQIGLLCLVLALCLWSECTYANSENKNAKWEFYSVVKEPSLKELEERTKGLFDARSNYLYRKFLQSYVVKEQTLQGDSKRRIVIRKPILYQAVRSIRKQLKKQLKKDLMSKEDASERLTDVLLIALSAVDSESASFEKAVREHRKDAQQLLVVFSQVKLTQL